MMNVKSIDFFQKLAVILTNKSNDEIVTVEELECLKPEELNELIREHLGGDLLPEHNYKSFSVDDLMYCENVEEFKKVIIDKKIDPLELNHFLRTVEANKKNYERKFVNMLKKSMYIE